MGENSTTENKKQFLMPKGAFKPKVICVTNLYSCLFMSCD